MSSNAIVAIVAIAAMAAVAAVTVLLALSGAVDPAYYASSLAKVIPAILDGGDPARLAAALPGAVLLLGMAVAGRRLRRDLRHHGDHRGHADCSARHDARGERDRRSRPHADNAVQDRIAELEERLAVRTRQLVMARAALRDRRSRAAPPAVERAGSMAPAKAILPTGESDYAFAETIVIDGSSARALRPGCGEMAKVGIAVLTADASFARFVAGVLADTYRVRIFRTLAGLAGVPAAARPGVLVTDAPGDGPRMRNMIATLRRLAPDLVIVLARDPGESPAAAPLLARDQVYRCFVKPVDTAGLMQDVNAAVLRHLRLRESRASPRGR